ncbi:hypothetical protein LINPERPRIM_LOCUS42808 [Linum perenne]
MLHRRRCHHRQPAQAPPRQTSRLQLHHPGLVSLRSVLAQPVMLGHH